MSSASLMTSMRTGGILVLLVTVSLALAGSDGGSGLDLEPILTGDFQVGNLNSPVAPAVPDIFMGNEEYAFHIFPAEQTSCSEDGFILESISQRLFFDDSQVPANFVVQGVLLKADFDAGSNCWVPGPILYEGPHENFTIIDQGNVTIQVMTPGAPTLPLADHYFLVLRYEGGSDAYLVVDDQPLACTEYINRGTGWEDLNSRDKSGGGKVILYGDIVCSPTSVPNTAHSWDGIKSLYK